MISKDYTQSTHKWTKESIINLIRANAKDGYCKSTDVGMSCTTMAKKLFGSFANALDAAGVKIWTSRPRATQCAIDGCTSPLRSGRAEYCEVHYYRLRRRGTIETLVDTSHYEKCAYCSTPANGRKFCDAACRSRHERGTPLVSECRICKTEFRPINKNVCCSEECSHKLIRIQARAWYAQARHRPEIKQQNRTNEYKRKALRANAYVEHVDLQVVFKRDKGICWLCGESVDLQLKWPDRGFATLDHVVPLVRGGMHSYSNIRLAHLRCNCRKGAREVVEAGSNGLPLPSSGQVALF